MVESMFPRRGQIKAGQYLTITIISPGRSVAVSFPIDFFEPNFFGWSGVVRNIEHGIFNAAFIKGRRHKKNYDTTTMESSWESC